MMVMGTRVSPHHHADPAAARFLPWLSHLYRGECTWKKRALLGGKGITAGSGSFSSRHWVSDRPPDCWIPHQGEQRCRHKVPWGLVGHRGRDETGLSLQNNNSLRSDQERRRGLARLGQLFGGTTQSTGMLQRTGGGVLAQLERGV